MRNMHQKYRLLIWNVCANVMDKAFEAGICGYIQKDNDAMHYIQLLRKIKNAVDKYKLEMQLNNKKPE